MITPTLEDNALKILYMDHNKIKSRIIDQGIEAGQIKIDQVETGQPGDHVRTLFQNNLTYWYDGYCLAYGFQKIRNNDELSRKQVRKVFYLNKVAY